MEDIDIWITRYNGGIYIAKAMPNEEPTGRLRRVGDNETLFQHLRALRKNKAYNIVNIGITSPESLGLT